MIHVNYEDNDIEEQNDTECDRKPLLMQTSNHVPAKSTKSDVISSQLTGAIYQYSTYRKNRRGSRRVHPDQWNRKFVGILCTALVLVIYIFFANQPGNEQPTTPVVMVNVPPQDETLPGPKGKPNAVRLISFSILFNSVSSIMHNVNRCLHISTIFGMCHHRFCANMSWNTSRVLQNCFAYRVPEIFSNRALAAFFRLI